MLYKVHICLLQMTPIQTSARISQTWWVDGKCMPLLTYPDYWQQGFPVFGELEAVVMFKDIEHCVKEQKQKNL